MAMALGYVLGARAGSRELDEVVRAVRALRESEEWVDLVGAVRAHAGQVLRDLADVVEGDRGHPEPASSGDLVDRVRDIIAR